VEKVFRHVRDTSLFLPILFAYLVLILIVSPVGDFPLNDDWVYAKTVQSFLDTGTYAGHPFTDALFVLQAFWGYLWTSVFGFSFTVLRFSTIACAILGAWGIALAARHCGLSRGVALVAAGLFLSNPIILNLTYTFMTDVPFLSLTALSMASYLKFFSDPARPIKWVLIGSILAALSCLIRQFGIFTGAAFVAVLALDSLQRKERPNLSVLVAWLAPWLVVYGGTTFLPDTGAGLAMAWDWDYLGWSLFNRISNGTKHFFTVMLYQAYFLLPLVPLFFISGWRNRDRNFWKILVGAGAAFLFCIWMLEIHLGTRIPLIGNMLYDFGVGPLLFSGMRDEEGLVRSSVRIGGVWGIITLLTAAAAACALVYFVRYFSSFKDFFSKAKAFDFDRRELFLLTLSLLFVMGLFNPGLDVIYDRYFVAASIPFIVLALMKLSSHPIRYMSVATVLWLTISAFQVHDYMSWNRARWEAIEILHNEMNIEPEIVNGGYEYNGWFTSDPFFYDKVSTDRRIYGTKGWWVVDDDYAMSMVQLPNYEVERTIPYSSWFGLSKGEILIQRRVAEDENPFI